MNGRLSFDVYVDITDPPCRVTHDAHDNCVSMTIGGAQHEIQINLLQLWFKEPDTVLKLGRDLISAAMRLAAQKAGTQATSAQANLDPTTDHHSETTALQFKLVRLREGVFATGKPMDEGDALPRVVHVVDSSADLSSPSGVTALCGAHFAPNCLIEVAAISTKAHRLCLRHLPTQSNLPPIDPEGA